MSAEDAQLALRALDAEVMYADPTLLTPAPTPQLAAAGWAIRGYVTGIDAVLRLRSNLAGADRRYYGFLAERTAGEFLVVIRGTSGMVEWLEDLEGEPVPHPEAGKVHWGFYSIYQSLAFIPPSGGEVPLLTGLCHALPLSAQVTVVGHSLGSPLANYLTLDLAPPGCIVRGRFFASPRPGDEDFGLYFDNLVRDYRVQVRPRDLVPRVPFGFGYQPLPKLTNVPESLTICDDPLCNHHALSYATDLDPALLPVAKTVAEYSPFAGCLP